MQAEWRRMEAADLKAVKALGDAIHRDYPERFEVLAERQALHPAGCRVLAGPEGAVPDHPVPGYPEPDYPVLGYVVSHPWGEVPPALDMLLGALPAPAATYYLHDLALAPAARGAGAARRLVDHLAGEGRRTGFRHLSLTAVGRSHRFWRAQGFVPVEPLSPAQIEALASYGESARLLRLAL